jgi:hypothetical protein
MVTIAQSGKNIKIVAQGFNPPLFTEYWLKKENFIPDNLEITPLPISTPQFTQIASKKFLLLVLPDQLQLNITDDTRLGIDFIMNVVEKVPSLKYIAMGFNFDYFVPDNEIKHGFFYVTGNKLFHEFNASDAKYGTFLSKNFEDSRLSVSVKPTKAIDPKNVEIDVYHFSINFHFNLIQHDGKATIVSSLDKWNTYKKYAEKLMEL